MNYTTEPWTIKHHETQSSIFSDDWGPIAGTEGTSVPVEEKRANAERIVACVHACKGYDTVALQAAGLGYFHRAMREMIASCRKQEAAVEEAREWVEKLQRERQTLTCVYCGQEYPPGSPTHGAAVLTEHIKQCEKHPMRKLVGALKEARAFILDRVDAGVFPDRDCLTAAEEISRALEGLE